MSQTLLPLAAGKSRSRRSRYPLSLFALFVPGGLFVLELFLVRHQPRFTWLASLPDYPWEFWVVALFGCAATAAGVADWLYHRSGQTTIGAPEHHSELVALAGGGLPLFVLMSIASILRQPAWLLVPVIVVLLFTTAMICYDEFVFHRKRCGRYETALHRVLVFGNGIAWLAWANWCFVRGGGNG
jgi:hypothetical protein